MTTSAMDGKLATHTTASDAPSVLMRAALDSATREKG